MGFLNSPFLYYMGFASVPIIIHILNRQRYKRIQWAAMEFLKLALQKVRRRIQVEDLLLLIIRTLIIVLLIGAFSKPYLKTSKLSFFGVSNKYYIFVLDSTLSMNLSTKGVSNFQRAKDNLIGFIDSISKNPQNKVSILLFKKPLESLIREPISDFERAKQIITEVTVSKTSGDLKKLFSEIAELVDKEKILEKEIYFLTDMQKNHWEKVLEDEEFKNIVKTMLTNNGHSANHFYIVDYGVKEYNNVTINKLYSNNRVVFKNVENQFVIQVKNNSANSTQIVRLEIAVDRLKIGSDKIITLPPGKSDTVSFPYTSTDVGPHFIQAKITEDDLSEDNTYNFVFNIPKEISVLIVNGNPNRDLFNDEVFYLTVLMNPCLRYEDPEDRKICESKANRPYTWEKILADELDYKVLSTYDVVIVANMQSFTGKSLENMKNYLNNGGVLIFFLGDKVDSTYYNKELFKEEGGYIMPCKLIEKKDYAETEHEYLRVSDIDFDHPMIKPGIDSFKKYLRSKLAFDGFWTMECPKEKDKTAFRTILSFNDKDATPLLFENSMQKGSLIWVNSTARTYWFRNLISVTGFNLLHKMLEYAISKKAENFNVTVGDNFSYTVRSDSIIGTLNVRTPSGQQTTMIPIPLDTKTKTYLIKVEENYKEGLKEQGIYEVVSASAMSPIRFFVGVNVDPNEGDLHKVTLEEIKKINSDINVIENFSTTTESNDVDKTLYRNMVKALLYTVLFLLFFELFIAHMFNLRRV